MENQNTMKKYLPAVIAAVILYTLFSALTFFVAGGACDAFDQGIEQAVYGLRAPGLNTLIEAITYCGNTSTIIVVTLLLLAYPKTRLRYGLPVFAVAVLTTVLKVIVKNAVERPRPDQIYFLIEQGGFSYPSGHSITSLAVYGLIAWLIWHYHKKASVALQQGGGMSGTAASAEAGTAASAAGAAPMSGTEKALLILAAFLAVAIGLSRIYVGVHHPTDILGGFLAGAATAILVGTAVVYMENSGKAAVLAKSRLFAYDSKTAADTSSACNGNVEVASTNNSKAVTGDEEGIE